MGLGNLGNAAGGAGMEGKDRSPIGTSCVEVPEGHLVGGRMGVLGASGEGQAGDRAVGVTGVGSTLIRLPQNLRL